MLYFGYVLVFGTQLKGNVKGIGFNQDEKSKQLKKSTALADPLSNV